MKDYHRFNIYTLLTNAYSADELRRLIRYHPTFRRLNPKLSGQEPLDLLADKLIDFCDRGLLLDTLLAEVEKYHPARYERHGPYVLLAQTPSPAPTASTDSTAPTVSPPASNRAPLRPGFVWVSDDVVRLQNIKAEFIRIPAGDFLYGDDKVRKRLPEFWIGKTPVTNAQYLKFVEATDHRRPLYWETGRPPTEKIQHPVVNVNWHDAVAFAEWLGGRLPSEEEWEKAARGTYGRTYPWGEEEPSSDLCNVAGNVGDTTPVGRYSPQGDSVYGCVDMAGNVWEWTASNYKTGSDSKVLRGGSWSSNPRHARVSYRLDYNPDSGNDYGGLRVVVAPILSAK